MIMIRFAKFPCFFIALVCGLLSICLTTAAQASAQSSRIQANIDDQNRAPLPGTLHPATKALLDLGRVPSDTQVARITIVFKRTQQQQQQLDALLQQQQEPASPNFHKWLTPSEFQSRFGITSSDLAAVKDWLRAQGLQVIEESSNNSVVVFSGTAAAIEQAFHTEIHNYGANGETHFANFSEVTLPSALAGVVGGIRGLNDFRPHPRPHLKRAFTSSISGSHFLAPDDFATIYNLKPLYSAGIDGTGQKIAIVGQSDIVPVAVSTFRSLSGLPASDPQVILIPGAADPGVVSGDIDEASLDIEWAGAVAPGATIVYVNSKNALDSLQYAIQNNVASVISSSYGDCEPNFSQSEIDSESSLFHQANAQGQTIVGAAGDSGAADCDYPTGKNVVAKATHGLAVDFPPSSPNVTAIGGSTFSESSGTFWSQGNDSSNGSALSYIPEVAWNDTTLEVSQGGSLAASGGGVSTKFPKPLWQVGAGVPADGQRDLPDLTFAASSDHDGYLVCSKGTSNTTTSCVDGYRAADTTLTVVGGTSVGAPTFAGVVALLNQKMGSAQGNVNPILYTLAANHPDAFNDITSGDNKVPCSAGTKDCPASGGSIGYSAGPGYDLVTGLGSINIANLVYELGGGMAPAPVTDFELGIFQTGAKNADITFTRGTLATTDTITVSALNGFSGNVTLTCSVSSSLSNTTCKITPASVSGSGTATLTVSASPIASLRDLPRHEMPNVPLWASSAFGLCALVFAGKSRAPGEAASKAIISSFIIAMIAVIGIGCGGGSSPVATPPPASTTTPVVNQAQSGTVTIQAASGALNHTVSIGVTVN